MTKQSAGSKARAFIAALSSSCHSFCGQNLVSWRKATRRSLFRGPGIFAFVAAIEIVGAMGAAAQAPTLQPSWNQLSPATVPPERYITNLTYDATHNQVVMFGGFGASGDINDTWLWNGTTWTQAAPSTSPSPRSGTAMAYDASSGNVVLFGGLYGNSTRYADTWIWDGTNWTQVTPGTVAPAAIPPARASGSMVYDAALGKIVMFGGVNASGMDIGDTWEWDGASWTPVNTAHSPSPRAQYGLAYDAINQVVVLFGGSSNGVNQNDTWVFNGTDWTLKSPATNPPARESAAMAYDPALGQTVMWGGYNGNYLIDTWTWDGTNWTQAATGTSPAGRYADNGTAYDAVQGQMILFGGLDSSQQFSDTWEFGLPQNFGSINVCPLGQTAPAPCSNTLPMTFNFAAQTPISLIQVVTQGAASLEFTQANGGNCSGTISAGNSCTLDVAFTPQAPGVRLGAVEILSGGTLVSSTPIYGIGEGPAIAFAPGTQTTVPTSGLQYPDGVAVDAAGNVFIADYVGGKVVKVTPGGVQTTVPATGLSAPIGVAVDGAGDVFIVDLNLSSAVEVTPSGVQTSVGSGLGSPIGVAVDGAGDVFIGDQENSRVVEITPTGVQTTVPATGLNQVWGVAVDGAGDVFIADGRNSRVVEVTPSGVQSTVPATGLKQPYDVAVDGAGDVFIADPQNARVVEVPAGGGPQTTVGSGLSYPSGVAVDQAGDVFIGDQGQDTVFEVNRSQTPSLSFDTTYVGYSSDDSPKSVTVQNVGNQALNAISPGLVFTDPDFVQVTGSGTPVDCTATFSLNPGTDCNVSISFTPLNGGLFNGSAVFSDNALNAPSATPAQQTVALSGGAFEPVEPLNVTGSGSGSVIASPTGINCNINLGVNSGTCTSSYSSGTAVSLEEIASPGFTFAGWGGACSNAATGQFCNINTNVGSATNVTANFAPNASYTLAVTAVGSGTGSVSSSPTGITCTVNNGTDSGTCAGSYTSGTPVTLTANATGASTFVGWGGACAGSGASATCGVTMNSSLNVSASFVAPGASQAGVLKPITAGVVYGQGGSFTSNTANNGGVSANSLQALGGIVFDARGNLYVADGGNNRVLFYPAGSTTATRVYGQGGSFSTNIANYNGITADSLADPQGLAVDSNGNLYVADESNNRVLFYPAGSTTATRVYGQSGSFTSNTWNNGGVSANSLGEPYGLAVDSAGNLYVGDYQNNRVLFYPSGSTTATQVYGQGGSFISSGVNTGGISANSLNQPTGVALDSSGDLYVADIYNNRVLFYPYGSTTATQVYGQGGSFTSNGASTGNGGLNNPMYIAPDSSGDLYVVDRSNNRVLFYPFGSTTATRVYGQLNNFATSAPNNGGLSANTLSQPWAVALDNSGNLYVTDYSNNRVLEYGSFGNVNVCPAAQNTPAPCNNTITLSYYASAQTSFGVTQVVTQGVTGLDFALASGGTCTGTVSAQNTCTVNVNFTPLEPGSRMGAVELFDSGAHLLTTASIYGIGQGPESAFGPGAQSTVNTGSFPLSNPRGMLVDAVGNLFISDVSNLQVLKIAPNGSVSSVGFGFQYPQGMAEDGAGDLFVADDFLNEIVEIPAGCASITCQVYLGSNFRSQLGVAVDGAGDVFFGDFLDGEVVELPAGCTSAACQKVVYHPAGSNPVDLTADGAGDLFIADYGLQKVIEIPAGCVGTGCQITIGSGWIHPDDTAVDAAGDVFVADEGLKEIVEVPAGCTNPNCQVVVVSGIDTVAVALDPSGDLVVDDLTTPRVFEVNRSQPPSFNFALTNVSSTSLDSPQSVTVQNVGNQPLTGTLALAQLGANFAANGPYTCGTGFTLIPGAGCSESLSFTPQTTGYLTGSAAFSDNTLNLSPLVVLQTVNLSGNGGLNGQAVGVVVPNVVGLTQAAAATAITNAGLTVGTVSTAASSAVPSGSVSASNPAAGAQVSVGSAVRLLVSNGQPTPPAPNPLTFENNYFVTGDYATGGVSLRGTGNGGVGSGTINISDSTSSPGPGVPDGADIIDGYLYWESLENTASPSGASGTFNGYSITGQQIGSDLPYNDGMFSGTLRVYRADVNTYFPIGANGVRYASGSFKITLPDGGNALPLNEGASLVVIYRVLVAPSSTSPAPLPLKSVVIYDGAAKPTSATTQNVQGFYDAVGGASGTGTVTTLFNAGGTWNNSVSTPSLGQTNQYSAPLNAGSAYAAVILSTPVNNSDNDGILNAWKAGPAAGDFYAGQPGYYDVKTGAWVPLPGAKAGQKDLFVQLDYMCGVLNFDGSCNSNYENLFPAPDARGNDPLAMVTNAFAQDGIVLHLEIGNAVPEDTCYDNLTTSPPQLCQFPSVTGATQPGVIGWKNSLEFSKLWPRNLASCAAGGDCSPRFPYGQKDSYHYVLFGHSLAIPAWNTRYGSLKTINVSGGANSVTTIGTMNRGAAGSINYCPSRITISGVQGNPALNGVYNTSSCPDAETILVATPGVPAWIYPNGDLPEPVIGLTSGTVTSISGYSDLGGADSAVTLGLWETAPNQDMSKRANVIAGTLFHEIGHTLGLTHGGLYYDSLPSYVPNFDVNCKPNYQSVMNYLFQLDGVGPNAAIAFSNQQLLGEQIGHQPAVLNNDGSLSSVSQLTDAGGNPATFSTSSWYSTVAPSSTASPATMHCDGTPLGSDTGYRVNGTVDPISPAWTSSPNIAFDGVPYTTMRGYNDVANMDLRQVGATGGEFASLASVISFGSSSAPLNIAPGGSVAVGAGGTVTVPAGGSVTLGSNGNATVGSGGKITPSSGGSVTLNNGATVTIPSTGGTIALGSGGTVALGSGGTVTLSSAGTITVGSSGGTIALGSGGTIALGSGGTITSSAGTVTIPSAGGSYTLPSGGGTIALGSGGTIALGSGGTVALGSGGTIALGSGGTVALGSGGTVALGSGGTIALGSGGTIALGSGGNVTLSSGGTIALGSGGTIALGSGGTVALGSGGTVALGSGGNVTLGSGGTVALGSGGTVALGSGGTVALGSGGQVTLSSGGTIALGSGGTVALGSGGTVTVSGGTIALGSGGTIAVPSGGGTYTIDSSGGTITLPSGGGTVALGSGGTVALGSGGTITMGGGGTVALGSGGTVTLGGSGGVIALGSGGTVALGSGGTIALGSGGTVTLGSGGETTNELSYESANSIVRPPSSPTQTTNPAGVRIDWTAPAFGVVQTYSIYRSSDSATPILIGSVSGVNGNPPATEFIDTNPDLTSQTVVYTISTTLLPIPVIDPTPRQSAPSPPAVVENDQTISMGSLPSSVAITNPSTAVTVTATALSGGVANGLQVNFSATGTCAIGSQSVASVADGGASTATVTLSSPGSCTITASQAGIGPSQATNPPYYNAANSVSGTFTILPLGSTTQSQTINFTQLQNAQYGNNTFSLSASTLPSGQTVSFTASGPCTASGSTLAGGNSIATGSISGVGLCKITASSPAYSANNVNYSAASVNQSFTISPAVLKVTASNAQITYGQPLPSLTPSLGVTYTLSGYVNGDATANPAVVSGTPTLSTTATTSSDPGNYPITVSTGSLAAANYSFLYVSGTLNIKQAAQTIGFTTNAPPTAAYTTSFTVAASAYSGSPATINGNAVAFTSSGSCSITNSSPGTATYTMNNSTGTCSVIANQAGNADYAAAPTVTQSVTATGAVITVSPSSINFGTVVQGSITTKTVTVTNGGSVPLTINQPLISIVKGGNSNEFVAVNLCPSSLAAGKSCAITITFVAGPYYTQQTATLEIMDNAPGSPQAVSLSALVLIPQTITFTTNPPPSAAYGGSFTVGATGGGSGNAVSFTSSGSCSNSGATYTMTSGTGTCSVIANQAGNATYAAASQVTKTVSATLATQTITFNPNPPASAAYKSSFTVTATGGGSGNAVTFTSSGSCSNVGATYTMTKSTGTCSVIASQAGNSNYTAAAQVTKTVYATLAAQTITFTTAPPAAAAYKSSFTVAATGGGSGNAVTFASSGSCTNAGATYTMTKSTGTCSVIANQAGNSNYTAAAQVTKTVSATLATQTIAFTTNPPATAAYKSGFTVSATGGGSGNAVTFTSSGSCSNSGATFTMTSGTGTCSVIANQAGNSNYTAATQVTKTVSATYSLATLSPASLNFGSVNPGKSSASQTVTLKNTGTTLLLISSIGFSGTNPGNFAQTNSCSSSLAAGASCSISVKFNSQGMTATANLAVTDNTSAGTQTVALLGN